MTFEELKAEARAQGFKLIPVKEKEKLLPCTCGSKRREHWSRLTGDRLEITLCCSRCGKRASGTTEAEARHNWNDMISSHTEREQTERSE